MAKTKRYGVRFGMPDGKPITVPVRAASAAEARAKALDKLCEGSTQTTPVPPAQLADRKPGELGKRWRCPYCGSRHFHVERANWGVHYECAACEQGLTWHMPPPGTFDPSAETVEGDRIVFGFRTGWTAVVEPWKRVFDPPPDAPSDRPARKRVKMTRVEFDDLMARGLPRDTDEATANRIRSQLLDDSVILVNAPGDKIPSTRNR